MFYSNFLCQKQTLLTYNTHGYKFHLLSFLGHHEQAFHDGL